MAILCQLVLAFTYCCRITNAQQISLVQQPSFIRRGSIAQSIIEEPSGHLLELDTVTRLLVLKAIEFNRFIIHYRLESDKQPKLRLWRYFLAEEILSACNMSYDTMLVSELGAHLNTPQTVSKSTLRAALSTSLVGTTVGASGSVIEVGSNVVRGFKNRSKGFDIKTAARYFVRLLGEFDDLLIEREYLVAEHKRDSSYRMLTIESDIYRQLRAFYLNEFLQFHENTAGFRNYETVFYALNAIGDILEASAALAGLQTVSRSQYNMSSSILYTAGGAITMVAPLLSSAAGTLTRKRTHNALLHKLGSLPTVDLERLQKDMTRLTALDAAAAPADKIPTVPIALELAEFTQTGQHFQLLLEQETFKLKDLSKVAVQTNTLGPAIGATALTEGVMGILATSAARSGASSSALKNAIAFNFAGAVGGLAGAATSTGANIGILAAHTRYTNRLRKEHRLPEQLALQRLHMLDHIEESAEVLP
jgi:hypothetical protein